MLSAIAVVTVGYGGDMNDNLAYELISIFLLIKSVVKK